MVIRILRPAWVLLLSAAACAPPAPPAQDEPDAVPATEFPAGPTAAPFDFTQPVVQVLPQGLHEISGLAIPGPGGLAAVQDEDGAVYLSWAGLAGPWRRERVTGKGDFEGLAANASGGFLLRSDGRLFAFEWKDGVPTHTRELELHLPHKEWEGLCYDPAGGLWVSAKDASTDKDAAKHERFLYRIDPAQPEADPLEIWSLKRKALEKDAARLKMRLPGQVRDDGSVDPDWKFAPSGIAWDPKLPVLYLLSGPDHLLLALHREQGLLWCHVLPGELLPQPEGIVLEADGNLLIASEGVDGPARIVRYRRRPLPE
ncbi:MAG: hypothetical protein R3F17_16025 [Planctomycetota bacterium]